MIKYSYYIVAFIATLSLSYTPTAAQQKANKPIAERYVYHGAGNPYLPLWEHVPDGEPRVFEDPDRQGQYRVYIVGSHDTSRDKYCGSDIRMWSAPVEDLTAWRDEGPIFTYKHNGKWDIMYAPDLVEVTKKDGKKKYYLYPHSRGYGREAMVCIGDRPDGPFTPVNLSADGSRTIAGSCMGFDPAVYVEPVTDPSDPDYATGWHAWGYWGFQRSSAAQLNPATMYSIHPGTKIIKNFLPSGNGYGELRYPEITDYPCVYSGEDPAKFNYFEASSIRRIGNKYVMIYSGYSGPEYGLCSSNSTLRFAYADSPLGPWKIGGIVVDSRAPELDANGSTLKVTNGGHNTHGSLQEINGQWYVFYHRPPRNFGFARQSMVAPVTVHADKQPVSEGGKVTITGCDPYNDNKTWKVKDYEGNEYDGAEVTSEGFHIFGLDPYQFYPAGIACYLSDTSLQQDSWDVWSNTAAIAGIKAGDIVGFKYFGFGGLAKDTLGIKAFKGCKKGNRTRLNLWVRPLSAGEATVSIWIDGPSTQGLWHGKRIGQVKISTGAQKSNIVKRTIDVARYIDGLSGKHSLYLKAEGTGTAKLFDLMGIAFSSKDTTINYPEEPTVTVKVNGKTIQLPEMPMAMTEDNGYTDCTNYETDYTYTTEGQPVIEAYPSTDEIEVNITQPTPTDSTATIHCDYHGLVKTYKIRFHASAVSAITTPSSYNAIRKTNYYDLSGRRYSKVPDGICIRRTIYDNGKIETMKEVYRK